LIKKTLAKSSLNNLKSKKDSHSVSYLFDTSIDIPKTWESKRLDEVGLIVTGNTPSTSVKENFGNEYLWITPPDLELCKYITNSQTKLSKQGFEKIRSIPPDSIMFSCIGTIGSTGITVKKSSTNQQINSIITKNFDSQFVYYQLSFNNEKIKYLANQTAVPILNKSNFGAIKMVFPKQKIEQEKISHILSNVDTILEKTIHIIEKNKKIKNGLMQKFFSKLDKFPKNWDEKSLKGYVIGSGSTPRGGYKVYTSSGIPFIRSQNVHFDGLHLEDVVHISTAIHNKMKNTQLKPMDVVFNITGASIGRCTMIPENFGEGNVNQHVCILRTKDYIVPRFLSYYLSSFEFQKFLNMMQAGSSREGFAKQEFEKINVFTPSPTEQQDIADVLFEIDNLIKSEETYLRKLFFVKKGLMQNLLTGKVRVNATK